ncbi:uncharacterized protein B0T15DRAFT_136115 [Chaetomium strumarium]|uniref:Uncharacterized protein n=1 Tax=Chaetomium strumarium TaxID=1170767 RepID=A0AAJ0GUE8_9PEZI|nr:hypothetical protein B0T15DRAFT_136115 [Chaetomium strumarium]
MPAAAPPPWRVNAYESGRCVAFQYSFGSLENIRGNPNEVAFTSPCPYKTLVQCYSEPNGKGSVSSANFDAGSRIKFNVGAFKSWEVYARH